MICALIGDRTIGNLAEGHLEDRLRVLIEERHVSAVVMGYFGPFERLALRVIRRLQQDYPLLDYTVILCGPRKETPADPELDYLHTLYPQGCWLWPGRIGLTRKLCYLASASDMIAYYDDTEQRPEKAAKQYTTCVIRKFTPACRCATINLYSGQSRLRAEQFQGGGENLGTGMPRFRAQASEYQNTKGPVRP